MLDAKPCPFCGSDELELSCGTEDSDGVPCAINCKGCGALGPLVICDPGVTPLAMLTEAQEEWDQRATLGESGG
jgi:hypothetical protein